MQRLAVATEVQVDPESAFDFLVDFPRYANYSQHLEEVRAHGDGAAGTEYDLAFAWWRFGYTVRSRVTEIDRPDRIDWQLVDGLAARGHWSVEPLETETGATHSTVTFVATYDPETVDSDRLSVPSLLSMDAVVDRLTPRLRAEAERVVRRVVADLEGEPRDVELEIIDRPGA